MIGLIVGRCGRVGRERHGIDDELGLAAAARRRHHVLDALTHGLAPRGARVSTRRRQAHARRERHRLRMKGELEADLLVDSRASRVVRVVVVVSLWLR